MCGEDHSHCHHDLPAVFSHTFSMDFPSNIPTNELCRRLAVWVEALTVWAVKNHAFVGHIKVFAESKEGFRLWLSTTGKEISIRNLNSGAMTRQGADAAVLQGADDAVRQGTAAVTAIVFGVDEKSLEAAVLSRWSAMIDDNH